VTVDHRMLRAFSDFVLITLLIV